MVPLEEASRLHRYLVLQSFGREGLDGWAYRRNISHVALVALWVRSLGVLCLSFLLVL